VTNFTNAMLADPKARLVADRRAIKLLDDEGRQEIYKRNMRLIWLDHPAVPKAVKPSLLKGRLDKDAFADICGELAFHSLLKDLDTWLRPFAQGDK